MFFKETNKMSLLTKLKKKYFKGKVAGVELVDGFYDDDLQYKRYQKNVYRDIVGYDRFGKPIVDEYTVTQFKVALENRVGERRTFERFGRVPKVNTIQAYR